MDQLALELLTYIASFACVDGGYTARSLLLASSQLHAAVRPIRFHSVALLATRGGFAENVKCFLACLESERARNGSDAVPRVRNLFLAGHRPQLARDFRRGRSTPQQPRGPTDSNIALLLAVAGSVETLTIAGNLYVGSATDIATLVFPALRELTLGGKGFPYNYLAREHALPFYFPALERIHCYSNSIPSPVYQLASQLTHLRLTKTDGEEKYWDQCIREACAVARPFNNSDVIVRFPRMQQVIVQPPPLGRPTSGGLAHYNAGIESELWEPLGGSGVPAYFVPAAWTNQVLLDDWIADTALSHWRSRLGGGDGCWAVEPKYARSANNGALYTPRRIYSYRYTRTSFV